MYENSGESLKSVREGGCDKVRYVRKERRRVGSEEGGRFYFYKENKRKILVKFNSVKF